MNSANNNEKMPMKEMIEAALSKIREVVDVNTVIGEPINLPNDVSVIPFSKVSVGFASGGSEFSGKTPDESGRKNFAGGNGAGVSMTPLGFIVVEKGVTRVIELGNIATYTAPQDPVNRAIDGINGVIDKAPDLISKVMNIFDKGYTADDVDLPADLNVNVELETVDPVNEENE